MVRGKGKKKKWRKEFDPDSLPKRDRDYQKKIGYPTKRLELTRTKIPIPEKTAVSSKVAREPSPTLPTETATKVSTSTIPRYRIPFTYTIPQSQPIPPYKVHECLKHGRIIYLIDVILKTESPILMGLIDKEAVIIQEGDFKEVKNHFLRLVIYSIGKKRHIGLYDAERKETYLIYDIFRKSNVVVVKPYKTTNIRTHGYLNSYTVQDLRDCFLFLSCLSLY